MNEIMNKKRNKWINAEKEEWINELMKIILN